MNQREFRRNCKCEECEYMAIRQNSAGDDMEVCAKKVEVIQDMKSGKDKCRYSR